MEEIDLKELVRIFWEKKTTIILLVAIFMVVGFIYSSFLVVPKYSSSTKLVLAQSSSNSDSSITTTDITLNSKLISTYAGILESSRVVRQVISNLGIEDSEESIKNNVSVTSESGTDIIKITVTNTDPEKAADIANEMATVFAEEVKRLYGMDNINTLDPAEANDVPANINLAKTIIIFGAVGFIIAVAYVFIAYMLDNSIKSSDDVEKSVHVPVLASIPIYEADAKITPARSKSKKRSKGGKRK